MDIAGLDDTAGDLIEYVNQMVNKKLFNQAKHIRFLMVLAASSISDSRGNVVRKLLDTFLNIFQG